MKRTDSLRGNFFPDNALLEICGAAISTIIVITFSVSFAGLIFAGDLATSLGVGIGLGLLSTVVQVTCMALRSSFPGTIACPQDKPAAIIGITLASITGAVASEQVLPTVLAFIALTSVAFGIALYAGGYFRLGGLVRYMPFPVIGGFLAGTGCLIFIGAFTFMGISPDPYNLQELFHIDSLTRWAPAFFFGLLLFVALSKSNHFLILPGFIIGGVALSYVLFEFIDLSGTPADAGLVIGRLPEVLWSPEALLWSPQEIDWHFIISSIPAMGAVVLISTIAMLLNETGIEVATRSHMDFNQDMRVAGTGNIISGFGGGLAGYPLLGLSVLNHRVGVATRFLGLLTAGFTLLTITYGSEFLELFPRWVVAGILFYLAIDFLTEWLVKSRNSCSILEYGMIVVIMLSIVTVGILEGIGLGIVTMAIVFVFTYSRINSVKTELIGTNQRSNVHRAPQLEQILNEQGYKILILELQGYLFFGTANRVLEKIVARTDTQATRKPEFVVLDFRLVNGADASAVLSFLKLRHFAREHEITLVFTGLNPGLMSRLTRGGCLADPETCVTLRDLDHGIEWCEDQLIKRASEDLENFHLEHHLKSYLSVAHATLLQSYLEKRELSPGSIVFREGDVSDGMYFVASGSVAVVLNLDEQKPIRLRKLGAGTIFGEMSVYTRDRRSASVQVEENAVMYFLSEHTMASIERDHPELASAFHRYIVQIIAQRLALTNKMLAFLRL